MPEVEEKRAAAPVARNGQQGAPRGSRSSSSSSDVSSLARPVNNPKVRCTCGADLAAHSGSLASASSCKGIENGRQGKKTAPGIKEDSEFASGRTKYSQRDPARDRSGRDNSRKSGATSHKEDVQETSKRSSSTQTRSTIKGSFLSSEKGSVGAKPKTATHKGTAATVSGVGEQGVRTKGVVGGALSEKATDVRREERGKVVSGASSMETQQSAGWDPLWKVTLNSSFPLVRMHLAMM